MPSQEPAAKNYTFTSFTTDNESLIEPIFSDDMQFICYQHEQCPDTNRKHIQGYIQFKSRTRLTNIKKRGGIWATAHIERAKGTTQENIKYCSKRTSAIAGTFKEFGHATMAGTSTQLSEAINKLSENATLEEIRQQFPEIYIRHYKALERYIEDRESFNIQSWKTILPIQLFEWQLRVMEILETQQPLEDPHDRRINWIFDPIGKNGKSALIKYIIKTLGPKKANLIASTAMERVIYAMKQNNNCKVVLIDLPRDYPMDKFNYASLEIIKDGMGFNTLYHPGQVFWQVPHVIVFSNVWPNEQKLTHDRWNIIQISEPHYPIFTQ